MVKICELRPVFRWGVLCAGVLALSACARVYTPTVYRGSTGAGDQVYVPPTASARSAAGPSDVTREPLEARKPVDFGVATVRRGDTLYTIAQRHGVALGDLMVANKQMRPFDLKPGQKLVLPRPLVHKVGKGDTIYGLAQRYNVDMADLVKLNGLSPPYVISVGQTVRLPKASAPDNAVVMAALSEPTAPTREIVPLPSPRPDREASSTKNLVPPPRSGKGFLWPLKGRVLIGFGSRGSGLHNDGINIAARKGAAVHAAENGVVAYAGNEIRGFGQLILIRHQGDWTTAYAHNSKLLVRTGQRVRRGQVIAQVGRTGSVLQPQLHFEIRRGDEAVNPIKYLSVQTADGRGVNPASFQAARRDPG